MQNVLIALALVCAFSLSAAAEENSLTLKAEVPYREDAGLSKTEYFLAKGKYSEALDEAVAVLKRHPKSADAYTYRGLAYDRLGVTEKAVENFQKALALSPTHLGANKYLADTYLATGDLPRAMEQMQAIRFVCGEADCPELNELQSSINSFKKSKKEDNAEE